MWPQLACWRTEPQSSQGQKPSRRSGAWNLDRAEAAATVDRSRRNPGGLAKRGGARARTEGKRVAILCGLDFVVYFIDSRSPRPKFTTAASIRNSSVMEFLHSTIEAEKMSAYF